MDDRVQRLEEQVSRLAADVRRMEARLASMPGAEAAPATPAAPASGIAVANAPAAPAAAVRVGAQPGILLVGWASFIGRTFLILGGAFLIRALTDAGTLPPGTGVAVGLLYALTWTALAHRAAARGERQNAGFHAVTSAIVGYPLLWETATRLGVLAPPLAAAAITIFALASLLVAARHEMAWLAWTALVAALSTIGGLLLATGAIGPFAVALYVLSVAAIVLEDRRGFTGLRWPIALLLDLALVRLVYRFAPDSAVPPPPAAQAFTLLLALPALHLGGLVARSLVRRRAVGVFDVVEVTLALAIGLYGSTCVARAAGSGTFALGVACLALAVAALAVAFGIIAKRAPRGRDFLFYSLIGVVLVLAGSELVTTSPLLAVGWGALAIATAALGGRFGRLTMWSHAAIYLWAAALRAGLVKSALGGLTAGPDFVPSSVPTIALVVLAAAAVVAVIVLFLDRAPAESWRSRLPRTAIGLLVAAGGGGLGVVLVYGLAGPLDASVLAVVRTAVLAATALALASGRRWGALPEFAWLSLLVLALGGLKLLLEDLPHGRPTTLVPAFALYGLALIVVPRLARDRRIGAPAPGAAVPSIEPPSDVGRTA